MGDDMGDPMAAVLRKKLENGSITQSEYDHLRGVHQQVTLNNVEGSIFFLSIRFVSFLFLLCGTVQVSKYAHLLLFTVHAGP